MKKCEQNKVNIILQYPGYVCFIGIFLFFFRSGREDEKPQPDIYYTITKQKGEIFFSGFLNKKSIMYQTGRLHFKRLNRYQKVVAMSAITKNDDEVDGMNNDQLVEAMLRAKNERRRAESDVQLLANRLAHLRAEEEKARRKIDETKKRAGEILEMKDRNATVAKRKQDERASRKAIVNREQQLVAMRRQKLRDDRKVKGTKSNASKLDYVKQQREEKLARQEQGKRRKAEEVAKARAMKEKIRQREIAMRQKREREEKERRAKQAEEYKRRLTEERSKQIVADEEISKMEEEEMRLIERLRATQDMQRQAYATLEAALVSK